MRLNNDFGCTQPHNVVAHIITPTLGHRIIIWIYINEKKKVETFGHIITSEEFN